MPDQPHDGGEPLLSVIVPVFNEAGTIPGLAAEIRAALDGVCAYEILFVDDGSSDGGREILRGLAAEMPVLRAIAHARRAGQSAGLRSGVLAARGRLIVTLDGDGQNDPADIPRLLRLYQDREDGPPLMVTGWRRDRRDSWARRRASAIANRLRRALLRDDHPDTGCSLKLYARELFLRMPYFDHMHRYLPALARREGARVEIVPVNHRERRHGRSKYRILDRLAAGIPDLAGVFWLLRRGRQGRLPVKEL